MKYSSSTLKVRLNQCALRALSRVAAIFTYIEIAALRVLAISEDFLRYVNKLGPDYMSRAVSVYRDLGSFVKRNKTQLCDYMTTGPARLAEIPV